MFEEKQKIKVNYLFWKLSKKLKDDSPYLDLVRELAIKFKTKTELYKNRSFQMLLKKGIVLDVVAAHNLTALAGRTAIIRRLVGDTTYTGEVDWGALGNGAGALTASSTQLSNEIFRKQASSQAYDGNVAYVDWFIAAADVANQTFTQFGSFIDGSASANSGQAFSLLSGQTIVKSGSLFISAKYTLN